MLTLYWIDTRWACGGVLADATGLVRETCPIFRKFIGQRVAHLMRAYRVVKCN